VTAGRLLRRQRVLLLLMALFLAAGCQPGDEPPARAATRVGTGIVTLGPAEPPILTSGMITTRDELKLSFKVAGIVRRIGVHEGEVVRAGQELAALELTDVNAQLEQAQQLAAKAERDLVRGENLRADEVISEEVLESLRTQAAVARAALRSAKFNREFAAIEARNDGVVLRKLVEEREFVQPGQPVLVVGPRAGGFIVRAGLADRDVVRLRLGDRAIVTVDAFPDQPLQGRITVLPAASDSTSGLFDIEVELAPAPVRLVSGLLARLRIEPALASETTLAYAPIAAVIEADGDQAAVFVVENEVARRRPVRVAFIAPAAVAIAEGLRAGEVVVTDGALYLEDGESVQAISPAAAAIR